ncbi:MAG: bifunctional diaminohydroxyphosphoribosylaminopyrimidine deaminase/5-amino-6-(5-phosphoribosylamino)uracil reductase RibD [Calditrichaceae bacterium]
MNAGLADDHVYMRRCLELACRGKGEVSPNPLVGAIIVKNGKIIAEGWHERYGSAHAELNAIRNAIESVEGATLYCNLEPCCHTEKQTPPCTPLIIRNKLKRVVISNFDPNPMVSGQGIKQLSDEGIEVTTGVLRKQGEYLNRFFLKYIQTGLPYVTMKIAQSMDGKISARRGTMTWLTGNEAVEYVHRQRAGYDAVMIGAGTVSSDDPQLTVRKVQGRNPYRIVIDGHLSSPTDSKIFNDEDKNRTWIFTAEECDTQKVRILENRGIRIFRMPADRKYRLDLQEILKILGKEKIISVMVEGGQELFSSFISNNHLDELIILQAPVILGRGLSAFDIDKKTEFELRSIEKLGNDIKIELKKKSD